MKVAMDVVRFDVDIVVGEFARWSSLLYQVCVLLLLLLLLAHQLLFALSFCCLPSAVVRPQLLFALN